MDRDAMGTGWESGLPANCLRAREERGDSEKIKATVVHKVLLGRLQTLDMAADFGCVWDEVRACQSHILVFCS